MTLELCSIRTEGTGIEIVDQLLLPHQVEWLPIRTIDDAHEAIKSMKIRGAPAIASLASLSIASHVRHLLDTNPHHSCFQSPQAFQSYIQLKLDFLYTARPTAVNLGAATRRLAKVLAVGIRDDTPATEIAEQLVKEGKAIAEEDVGRNKLMAKHGAEWLLRETARRLRKEVDKVNILTVCNTGSLATSGYGTAFGLARYLFETGKLERAYYTQTTPYHQGSRLTALEFKSLGAPATMLCDSMVGSLFQHYKIDAVIVGADRIAHNGDTANKIGTFNAAVLAKRYNVPFIVVAPVSTVDMDIPDGSHIPIEHRPAIEAQCARGVILINGIVSEKPELATVLITPAGLDGVYNPSFDVTPAELISAIVTEKGVAVKAEGSLDTFDLTPIV